MSTLKVGGIRGVSASSDAITVANDGTCTANITNNLSNRNKIRNGAMQVSQRAGSFTGTSNEYTLDGFLHSTGSSYNFDTTTTQAADAPDGFNKSLKITPDSTTAPTGGQNGLIETFLEGQFLQDLAYGTSSAKSFTLSWYAKSSSQSANHQYTLWMQHYNSGGNRFIQNRSFVVTASWQRFSITIPGNTSENIIDDHTLGLRIGWILTSGPDDIQSEKTTWTDSNFFRAVTGQSDFMDNTSNEFYLTGVQLEVGSVLTDFEHLGLDRELKRCQRYYFKLPYQGTCNGGGFMLGSGKETGSSARICIIFPAPMRVIPSCAASNLLSDDESSATSANTINQVLASNTEPDRARVQFTGGSYSGGNATSLTTSQTTDTFLEANAELLN